MHIFDHALNTLSNGFPENDIDEKIDHIDEINNDADLSSLGDSFRKPFNYCNWQDEDEIAKSENHH